MDIRLIRGKLMGVAYRFVLKPIFFLFSAESVHHHMTRSGAWLGAHRWSRGLIRALFHTQDPALKQTILGIDFANPIGLAAGFDYQAELPHILPSLGMGFGTIGTITNEAYEGNPRPMLGRLPKSKSLLVNKGFKNDGIDALIHKTAKSTFSIPIGLSLGKTNQPSPMTQQEAVRDVTNAFVKAKQASLPFSYYELNISCPNLYGNVTFYQPELLRELLVSLSDVQPDKPVFIKMPITESDQTVLELLKIASEFPMICGVIFGNLWKDRTSACFDPQEIACATKGNFSGKPTCERSNQLIKLSYETFGNRFVIIGCGGVFNAEDAYKKIRLGASLIQMITGMIYEGPQVVGEINLGLAALLKKDGYQNIREAIGVEVRGK